jgi:hypothetical protein
MKRVQHPALDEMYAALDEVENIEQMIEEMKQQLRVAKQQLNNTVADLPVRIGDNEDLHDEIFHYLYWFEDQVSGSTLRQVFNMVSSSEATLDHGQTKTKTGKRIIKPATFDVPCTTCNQPIEIQIASRGDLQWRQRYYKGDWRKNCKECQAKSDARFAQKYRQEQAERQRRLDELHTMPYREYLQSPEWQVTRKRAMKRSGFRCQVCNAYGVRLNVHHRTYERRGYEENQDLIVLCEGCHSIFHENGSLARY